MSKNLYDNFRKNGSKLTQQPSDRAWKRLENRLDGSSGVQRTLTSRWWLMAASVALMVAVTAGVMLFTENTSQETAQAEGRAFFVSEDLEYTDTDVRQYAAVQLQKRLDNNDWQPINEGKVGQRLVAVRVNKSPSRASKPQAADNQGYIAAEAQAVQTAPKTKNAARQNTRTGRQKPDAYADFKWLPGTWITTVGGQKIVDVWQMHSGAELTNAGSPATAARMPFIVGLQCYGTMCDLKMVINQTGTTQLFALTEKNARTAEFWSEGKGFPETVMLQKVADDTFQIRIEGGKPNSAQRKYLEESGFVFRANGAAVRTARRR